MELTAAWESRLLDAAHSSIERSLSYRESEVIELGAAGRTDKQIAATLGLSPTTVATHWERIREKLGAPNRASAIAKAIAFSCRSSAEELAEKSKWLEAIFENAEEYAVYSTSHHGELLSWNKGIERVYGYRESEFRGKHVSLLSTGDAVQKGATSDGSFEGEHIHRDGQRFRIKGVLVPIVGASGRRSYLNIVRKDQPLRRRP